MTEERARIGLIGGSGVYDLSGIEGLHEEKLETPFGAPSDSYFTGTLGGVPVAFFSRHARGHRYSPTDVNYRANICGFKMLGCDALLSASAVGSLREEYPPRHAIVPEQFIDRTRHRTDTFFDGGVVAHAGFADPVCPALSDALEASARESGIAVHRGGTYVCMEGPQFSTRAESHLYRSWGADVIGMTNLTEARLAREAELCYATLAFVTDYDCWRESTEPVSVEGVLAVLSENAEGARRAMRAAVAKVAADRSCGCRDAMRYAILTDPKAISEETRRRLLPIAGRYL
ncbi:MAG TPA: S-methyl-5'-thioadenosine phosphorylase [Thermoanaerobaculia bacterium]|nr:S-methyl-5'-thioadenosine phosphorylase [Thermoanaerobaculia bacterium]HXM79108.1 S-methyl-5'-thioadenosine phosphorylase [Thermoanaerobaculia bacterium]